MVAKSNKITPHDGSDDSDLSDSDWSDTSSLTLSSITSERRPSQTSDVTRPTLAWFLRKLASNEISTSEDKWIFLLKIIFVSLVPILALIIMSSITISDSVNRKLRIESTQTHIKDQFGYQTLVTNLQKERALVISRLIDEKFGKESDFMKSYVLTDESFNIVTETEVWTPFWIGQVLVSSPSVFQYYLLINRVNPRKKGRGNTDDTVKFYASSISHFMNEMTRKSLKLQHTKMGKVSSIGIVIMRAKEALGNVHAMGCSYFYRGEIQNEKRRKIFRLKSLTDEILTGARFQSESFDKLYHNLFIDQIISKQTDYLIKSVINYEKPLEIMNSYNNSDLLYNWYGNMTKFVDILAKIHDEIEVETLDEMASDLESARTELVALVSVFSVIFLCIPFMFGWAFRVITGLQLFSAEIVKNTRSIREEQRMTEDVLLKMLPPSVAKQLKLRKQVNPEVFDSVSIFFSDVVGFTSISAKSTPMQVVGFLNQLYDFFDNVIDKYDVYKVETIGDAYMVASGLPVRNGERHAHEIASMALDLRDGIEKMQIPHMVLHKLQLRIGMHSGPCVAGVVGNKMPRYCLFGETVQIASKMEATGVAQKIQITKTMHLKLEKLGGHTYITEPRDCIEIEGIGEIERYWLIGRRTTFIKPQSCDLHVTTESREGTSQSEGGRTSQSENRGRESREHIVLDQNHRKNHGFVKSNSPISTIL